MRRLAIYLFTLGLVAAACADGQSDRVDATEETDEVPRRQDNLPQGPSALDNPYSADLPDPLVDTDLIISGGPPPDGIPPIDEPSYTVASEVDFIDDIEPVLVVDVEGETQIFPVQIMTWHELVNTEIGGVPVTVSYCPLCNSAITYDRRIETEKGEALLDFGTSGKLYNSALVMYDRQTESLWSHFTGQAVVGVLTGTELDFFPTATVGWAAALEAHPDALVLDRDTGVPRAYGQNPYTGYDDVTSSPFLFDGEPDGRLQAKTRVIGVRDGGGSVAVQTETIALPGVVEVDLGDTPLTVWRFPGAASALDTADIAFGRDVGSTGVFDRRAAGRTDGQADGEMLSFEADGDAIRDTATGSTWNILGQATDGPLAGTSLRPVEHVDTFWFAWAAFLPDTEVVPPPPG